MSPLAKLGRKKSTFENFCVYIVTISLVVGLIISLTYWSQFHQRFTHTFFVQKDFFLVTFWQKKTFV